MIKAMQGMMVPKSVYNIKKSIPIIAMRMRIEVANSGYRIFISKLYTKKVFYQKLILYSEKYCCLTIIRVSDRIE